LLIEIDGGGVGLVGLLVGREEVMIDEGLGAGAGEHFLVAEDGLAEIVLVAPAGEAEIEDVGFGPVGIEGL